MLMKHVLLNSGVKMPIIGVGTFKIRGAEVAPVIDAALASGYRAIDTASVYRNEATIGECLHQSLPRLGLTRNDVFITSKLGPKEHGYEACQAACARSLSALGLDCLDLYLVHWPGVQGCKPDDHKNAVLRAETWTAMELLLKQGKVRHIGVSNYTQKHLTQLLHTCQVKPAVLQVEHHPYFQQSELLELCKQHNIHYQAYSSLGTSGAVNKLLTDGVVGAMAARLGSSPAQVLLRWAVQQGIGVIPKSTNTQHIKQNIDIFDFSLSQDDMETLNKLNRDEKFAWDPSVVT